MPCRSPGWGAPPTLGAGAFRQERFYLAGLRRAASSTQQTSLETSRGPLPKMSYGKGRGRTTHTRIESNVTLERSYCSGHPGPSSDGAAHTTSSLGESGALGSGVANHANKPRLLAHGEHAARARTRPPAVESAAQTQHHAAGSRPQPLTPHKRSMARSAAKEQARRRSAGRHVSRITITTGHGAAAHVLLVLLGCAEEEHLLVVAAADA